MLVRLERASQVIHMTILHTAEFCSTVELECWSQLAQSEVDMIWTPLDFQGEATVISSMQDSCFPTLCFLFLFVHPGWIPTYNNAWPQHKGVSAALDLLSLQREASFAYLAENPTVFAYELHKNGTSSLHWWNDGYADNRFTACSTPFEALSKRCSAKTDLYRCKHGICPLHLAIICIILDNIVKFRNCKHSNYTP